MLMRGTTKRTRQQISDEFDKLKARANVGGTGATANASVETTRENLPAVLRLVAEILREPAFPADEFEQLRSQRLARLEEDKSEPQAIAVQNLQGYLRPFPRDDIRYIATTEESIAEMRAVTLDDAKRFYTDFYGASNGELSVVGDFDPAEMTKLATELLGSWKSPKPFTRLSDSYRDVAAVNRTFETPDKANAFFLAGINLNVRDDDPEYAALVLGNYMLGGGFLNSRLATRVRQKEGLSYGVGSQLQASSLDKNGNLLIFAIYAPQNAAKLEAAIKEEVARALREGFTDDEVKAAKAGWLQSQQVTRAQDGSLAGRLNTLNFVGRTVTWDGDFEKRVGALTPADIRAALTKHIDPERISFVKAGTSPRRRRPAAPAPAAPAAPGSRGCRPQLRSYRTRITTRRFQGSLTPSARSAASGALTPRRPPPARPGRSACRPPCARGCRPSSRARSASGRPTAAWPRGSRRPPPATPSRPAACLATVVSALVTWTLRKSLSKSKYTRHVGRVGDLHPRRRRTARSRHRRRRLDAVLGRQHRVAGGRQLPHHRHLHRRAAGCRRRRGLRRPCLRPAPDARAAAGRSRRPRRSAGPGSTAALRTPPASTAASWCRARSDR